MNKTIEINGNEITLSNNTEWIFIYNDQFGHDIVETIMPLLSGAFQIVGGIIDELGGTGTLTVNDIGRIYNSQAMQDAFVYFMTVRFTDFINITWSMAKAADNSIKEPRRWVRELGEFPVDVIAPAVSDLIIKGFISSKNLERLREKINELRPTK